MKILKKSKSANNANVILVEDGKFYKVMTNFLDNTWDVGKFTTETVSKDIGKAEKSFEYHGGLDVEVLEGR